MKIFLSYPASISLSIIWIFIFLLSNFIDTTSLFCVRGINNINQEYWRYLTAGFTQNNMIHTLGNVYLLIWLGSRYEKHIGSFRFFIIGFIGSALTYLIFSFIYKQAMYSIGGSGYWYALVGYILSLQLSNQDFPKIGQKWMLIYSVLFLPVIPIIPGMNLSTSVFHGIALVLGVCMSFILK